MIYLSFVCAARNDNHGGNFFDRLKVCIQSFAYQAQHFKVPSEFIIVEWNPIERNCSLFEVIQKIHKRNEYCKVRIITVPSSLHKSVLNSEKISFYQMIAKNVGIKRAKGLFIIASNIDIVISNSLFEFFSKRKLKENVLYRSDRFDILKYPSKKWLSTVEDVCANDNLIRVNLRNSFVNLNDGISILSKFFPSDRSCMPLHKIASKRVRLKSLLKEKLRIFLKRYGIRIRSKYIQHTFACGDFTLLSKSGWHFLRGYPEAPIFSWHLDSVFCVQAHNAGFFENVLIYPLVHFHQEHDGGFTPEKADKLFAKLEKSKIPYIKDEFSRIENALKNSKHPIIFNSKDWGLGKEKLDEKTL
jgi:hypothetical protein